MNLVVKKLSINANMRAAYKSVGIPLWVTPQEATDTLRYHRWSYQISLELGEWFARVWSMSFATGYLGHKSLSIGHDHVLRILSKMGYSPNRSIELANLLLENLDGLYRKGCARRSMQA